MSLKQEFYHKAFMKYIRYGIPMELSLKKETADNHSTQKYIWRTQRDGKVRDSHRKNEGKVFSWDDPPATGHPGEDYGCRCIAEPYEDERKEFVSHELDIPASLGRRWENFDFVRHFYDGEKEAVTLAQIGHLDEIANRWAGLRLKEWISQIFKKARKSADGNFTEDFENTYNFESVEYSHGDSTVRGVFSGTVHTEGNMISVSGETKYEFFDVFTDPGDFRTILKGLRQSPDAVRWLIETVAHKLGIRHIPADGIEEIDEDDVAEWFFILFEFGGDRYSISGHWTSELNALIYKDDKKSNF